MLRSVYHRNEQTIVIINMVAKSFVYIIGTFKRIVRKGDHPKRFHWVLPIAFASHLFDGIIQLVIFSSGLP